MSARDLGTGLEWLLRRINGQIAALETRSMWNGSVHSDSPAPGTQPAVTMVSTTSGGYPLASASVQATLTLDPGRWVCSGFTQIEASATSAFVEVGVAIEWDDGAVSGSEITRIGTSRSPSSPVDADTTVAASFVAVAEMTVELKVFAGALSGFSSPFTAIGSSLLVARPG